MIPSSPDSEDEGTPYEQVAYRERIEQVVEEKKRALADPGAPWGEWFFFDGAKWWMGLLFLIFDTWIIAGGIEAGSLFWVALAALVPATYLELLLWRFLWFRPETDRPPHGGFRRTWLRPVEFGRWTPEGTVVRTSGRAALGPEGPNPKEFL
jgi:hypothetical protein